jgi:hypothetical protein
LLILTTVLFASGLFYFSALAQTTDFALPEACVEKGIKDPEECKRYMESLQTGTTAPTTTTEPTGPVCGNGFCEALKGESNASCPGDCPATFQLPQACVEKGIKDPEECKRYMESLQTGTTAPTTTTTFQLPQQCIEKGIKDPTECKRYMESLRVGTPPPTQTVQQACVEKGINDPLECERYIKSLGGTPTPTGTTAPSMPAPCVERKIANPEECAKLMAELQGRPVEELFLPQQCKEKGITSPEECKTYMQGIGQQAIAEVRTGVPVEFGRSFLPPTCIEKNALEPEKCRALMAASQDAGQFLPKECRDRKLTEPQACQKFFEERSLPVECREAGATTPEACKKVFAAKHAPKECVDAGLSDETACRRLIEKKFLPASCEKQGITDQGRCQSFLLEKHGRPDECAGVADDVCWRLIEAGKAGDKETMTRISREELPTACKVLGAADIGDCQKAAEKQYLPAECRDAGILSPEACKKHLFEKYQKGAVDGLPEECKEAGATDPESCKKVMTSRYFPAACIEQKITDPESCKRFIRLKSMPQECRDLGIETAEECESHFRNAIAAPACEAQGITDAGACEAFIYERVASEVGCRGLGKDECALALKERHLGKVLDASRKNEIIGEVLKEAGGDEGLIDMGDLRGKDEAAYQKFLEVAPFAAREARKLRVIGADKKVEMTEDEDIAAAAAGLLAFDDDGDGVPNDVESRRGFNPKSADSDGDGTGDGDELRAQKLTGVDKAMLEGRKLGHAKFDGELDEKLTVNLGRRGPRGTPRQPLGVATGDVNGDNISEGSVLDEQDNTSLDGTGDAGEVVTLYIYSELPIVVTTTVDENGQWSYDFEDQLKDGYHEVYVAVNDDTGKVVRKGNPLSFLVQGAQAATAEEAMAQEAAAEEIVLDATANVAEGSKAAESWRRYMIAGGALLIAAILALVLVLRGMKRPPPAAPPQA